MYRRKVRIGKKFVVRVNQNQNGKVTVNYIIIGRRGIILKGTQKKIGKSAEIDIKTTVEMAPASHIIVYYIHAYGEIIYDTLALNFEESIPNKVITVK